MSDLISPTNPTRDTIRRLKASIGAAASLNEVMSAVQVALGAFFPLEHMSPALSGRGSNQSAFASLPSWGSNRWTADPTPPAARTLGSGPARTGELSPNPPVRPNLVRTGELFLDPTTAEVLPEVDATIDLLVSAPTALATQAIESGRDELDSRARWRAVTQLMTLLLAGQEPAQLLPAALRLSIQTFGASGALIHLNADDIVPGERWFALGEPGFDAALRATARQRRGIATVAPDATLAGCYPFSLIVPIRSARGELGKYALFRATAPDFDADDREDACAVATLLAVALHQYRLARA